jgi:hypothetical protein
MNLKTAILSLEQDRKLSEACRPYPEYYIAALDEALRLLRRAEDSGLTVDELLHWIGYGMEAKKMREKKERA